MREPKISAGIWFLGAVGDRFVKQGYRPDISIEERFKLAGSIEGISGLEMHHPTEISDTTYKTLKKLADDLGLAIVMVTPHLWVDPRFRYGQFSNPDARLRRAALDFAKHTLDIAHEMGAEFVCYWPAQDGYEYPFQIDYRRRLDHLAENLAAWADYNPQQKIVVEYKAYDPRSRILLPTVGQCVALLNEIDRPNLGINIETGHALIMGEELAETFSFCLRYNRLFHTHWNDNSKLFDDDLMVGTINFWETLELLFWLEEWGYDGWFGLDLFPYREQPEEAIRQSIQNLRFGAELLARVPREEFRACFQSSDAIQVAQLQRRILGGA
ncbi:MAG TPA: sugar phosphate isomerase/epimerase family protein [Ktedonobacteraceae bacterium]|nr:sugar phosphate isomerase/epimerase family protein [Ktedonobacteraceae bacterium]